MHSVAERPGQAVGQVEKMSGDAAPAVAEAQTAEASLPELLGRICQRDQSAMAAFFDATASRAMAIARSILIHPEDSEEAVLDAYTQVWNKARSYRAERGSPMGWLTTIVRTRSLDRLRRRAAVRETAQEIRDDLLPMEDRSNGPERMLSLLQEGSAIRKAFETLSDIQRQVIALAYFRDFTHAEMATHLDMPVGTVKSHVHRAVKALKQAMSPQEDPHEQQ